jgi:hypothetical protein
MGRVPHSMGTVDDFVPSAQSTSKMNTKFGA